LRRDPLFTDVGFVLVFTEAPAETGVLTMSLES